MRKPIKKGARIKLADSDLSGTFVSDNNNGSVNIETDDGLIIPVSLSQVVISDSDALLSLNQISGVGKKNRGPQSGQKRNRTDNVPKEKLRDERYIAVVDLHMKIKPDSKNGPSPSDILDRQLSKFTLALRRAIAEHKKELIVIHGEGSGKLKEEVRKLSKNIFPHYSVMDAPLHKYGSGASRIVLK